MAVLEYAKKNQQAEVAIMALEAKKTFDNVNLQWLFQTLANIGFQGAIKFLKSMYAHPTARVHARNCLSNSLNFKKAPDKAAHYHHCCLI